MTSVFGPQRTAMLLGIEGKTAQAWQHALLLSQADAVLKILSDPKRLAIRDTAYFDPAISDEVLGTFGPTAPVSEGERLWRQADDTANRLEAPGFIVPVMTTSSLQFDPAQLALELRSDNDVFREALDAVALEERKAETTLKSKEAHLAESKRIDRACARLYEGFFLLADRADLLERFRRALRRRARRRASSADAQPPQDGEPSQDGEPFEGEPLEAASSED